MLHRSNLFVDKPTNSLQAPEERHVFEKAKSVISGRSFGAQEDSLGYSTNRGLRWSHSIRCLPALNNLTTNSKKYYFITQ